MKKGFSILLTIFTVLFITTLSVSAFTGSINTSFKQAIVCSSTGPCAATSTNTTNILNWKPTLASGIAAVFIDDTSGITGNVWGNTLGWINMHPTVASPTVVNATTGVISGYAFSPVCGYINFAPQGYGVTIVTEAQQTNGTGGVGKFQGYAWCGGQSGGWIQFDCAVAGNAACVKTDWVKISDRITVVAPTGGGGGGGGGLAFSGTSTPPKDSNFQNQGGPQKQTVDYTNEYRSDVDDSGIVDILDYNSLMVNWGKFDSTLNKGLSKQDRCNTSISKFTNRADINCDGQVDILDFNIVMIYWGRLVGPQVVK